MANLTPPPRMRTGFGKAVSLLNFIAYFTLLPALVKLVWPALLELPGT